VEWERFQQHSINDAEDCRICADAERKSEDGYDGESRILFQNSEAKTNVSCKVVSEMASRFEYSHGGLDVDYDFSSPARATIA
jgi:hypothetical protein